MRQRVSELIAGIGRPVAFYPEIARFLGGDVSTAVFVCQFLYWRSATNGKREVYKSRREIEEETALSERVQKRICRYLVQRGYVKIVKKGLPARNYYDWQWEQFDADFDAWRPTSRYQTSRLESTDGADKQGPMVPTTSETTSETTATRELSPAATTSNGTPRSLPKEAALASPKRETRAEKPRFDSKGFTDVWRQYAGADAVLTARCYRQAKEVVTEFGLERVSEWIARYFKRSDWWFAKNGERSFGAFYTHLEAIANAGRQRKAATGPLIPLCPNCGANGAYPAGGDFRECIECHTRFEDKSDA